MDKQINKWNMPQSNKLRRNAFLRMREKCCTHFYNNNIVNIFWRMLKCVMRFLVSSFKQFIAIVITLPSLLLSTTTTTTTTASVALGRIFFFYMCVTFHAEGNLFQTKAACGTLFFPIMHTTTDTRDIVDDYYMNEIYAFDFIKRLWTNTEMRTN